MGRWQVVLPAMEASVEGRHLSVSDGVDTLTVDDVLVGEVWFCSGQSNMGASLQEADGADRIQSQADHPRIRMWRVPQTAALSPRTDLRAAWVPVSPGNVRQMSAFAYLMARRLHQDLGVPVGIVLSAWGGSSVQAWMGADAYEDPVVGRQVPYGLVGFFEHHRPRLLYNGMVHPIAPFAIKGVVWYQGETDGMDERFNPFLYRYSLRAMIDSWRRLWRRPDLPFSIVQLPNLHGGKYWPVLRESQDWVSRQVPGVGMVTTIDMGQSRKLHPTNKEAFADRMTSHLLTGTYGALPPADHPRFRSIRRTGDSVVIEFQHGDGLATTDGLAPRAFELAGADRAFQPADASISGGGVVLRHAAIPEPIAVRYAFSPDPQVNLVNRARLPARPFRTDDWPVFGSTAMFHDLPARGPLAVTLRGESLMPGRDTAWVPFPASPLPREPVEGTVGAIIGNGRLRIQTVTRRQDGIQPDAGRTAAWRRALPASDKGLTVEMDVQVLRSTHPDRGVSLEVCLLTDGVLNRYRLDCTPLSVIAHRHDLRHVLREDGDNTDFHRFRLSVRADGVCQVYRDGEAIGLLEPERRQDPRGTLAGPYLAVGKFYPEGDLSAQIASVAYDLTGAYAPATSAR
jgi:sialate O-acetylesterase